MYMLGLGYTSGLSLNQDKAYSWGSVWKVLYWLINSAICYLDIIRPIVTALYYLFKKVTFMIIMNDTPTLEESISDYY